MNNWLIKQSDINSRKPWLINFLKKKNIPEDEASKLIDTFAKADPTKDTTAEYINWIIKMVLTNKIKEEDIDKVREYLKIFSKLKKSNKLKELKINSDINSYKDITELYVVVKDYLGKPVTKQESERNISYGIEKIYDKGGVKVYKLTEPGVVTHIAKDTNWCVKSYSTAQNYLSLGPLYLLEAYGEKYLISESTDQFKNVNDLEVSYIFFNKMLPILSELDIILRPKYLISNGLDEKYYPKQKDEIQKYVYINKALYNKEYEYAKKIINQLNYENKKKSYKLILVNKMIIDGYIDKGVDLAKEFDVLNEQIIIKAHMQQVILENPLTYHIKPSESLRIAKSNYDYLNKMIKNYAGMEIKNDKYFGINGLKYPSKEEYLKLFINKIKNFEEFEISHIVTFNKEIISNEIMDKIFDHYLEKGYNFDLLIKANPEYFTEEKMKKIFNYYLEKGYTFDELIKIKTEYFNSEIIDKIFDFYYEKKYSISELIKYGSKFFTSKIIDKIVDYYAENKYYFEFLVSFKPELFTYKHIYKAVNYYLEKGYNLDELIKIKPEYFTNEMMNKIVEFYLKKGYNFDTLAEYKSQYFTPEIIDKIIDFYLKNNYTLSNLIKYCYKSFTPKIINKIVEHYIRNNFYLDSLISIKPELFTSEIMDKIVNYYLEKNYYLGNLINSKPEYFTNEIMDKIVNYYIENKYYLDNLIRVKPEYFTPEKIEEILDYCIKKEYNIYYLIHGIPKHLRNGIIHNLILKNIYDIKYYNALKEFINTYEVFLEFIKTNINNKENLKKFINLYQINKNLFSKYLEVLGIKDNNLLNYLYGVKLSFSKWFITKMAEKVSYIDYSKFGVVKLIVDNYEIDLIAPRKETYLDKESRDPIVEYGTLQDDALRRDFTINSLYLDLKTDKIIDPTNKGIKDILDKKIRTTDENVDKIFSDDPLRMLRAIRQAYYFNFELDPKIKESIKRNANRLNIISNERIRDEFLKILKLPNAKQAIKDLKELGLLDHFLPELSQTFGISHDSPYHEETIEEHILNAVELSKPNEIDRLVALLHDIGKPAAKQISEGLANFYKHEEISAELAEKILRRLNFPNNIIKEVVDRVKLHMRPHMYEKKWSDAAVRRFIKDMGDYLDKVLEFAEIDIAAAKRKEESKEKDLKNLKELKERIENLKSQVPRRRILTGEEIKRIFNLKEGPIIGKILSYIDDLVLKNPNISREELINKIKEFLTKTGVNMKWFKSSNDKIIEYFLEFIEKNFNNLEAALSELEKYKEIVNKKSFDSKKILKLISLLSLILNMSAKEILALSTEELLKKINEKTNEPEKGLDYTERKISIEEIKNMKFEDFKKLSIEDILSILKTLKNQKQPIVTKDGSKIYFAMKEIDEDTATYIKSDIKYYGDEIIISYSGYSKNVVFKIEISKKTDRIIKPIEKNNNNVDVNNLTYETFKNINKTKILEIIQKYGPGKHKLKDGNIMIISSQKPIVGDYKGNEIIYQDGKSKIIIEIQTRPGLGHLIEIYNETNIKKQSSFPSNPKKKVGKTGLTEEEIWEYYNKNKDKIMKYLKNNYTMLKILTEDGFVIKKKDSNGNNIEIKDEKEYDRWNGGRQEFHITLAKDTTNIAWIDIDPHFDNIEKGKLKAKVIIKEILKRLKKINFDIKEILVFDSGGRGYHIFVIFNKEYKIQEIKEEFKKIINEFIKKYDFATLGIAKKNMIRVDLTTFHQGGSIRAPYSFNLSTGKPSKLVYKI